MIYFNDRLNRLIGRCDCCGQVLYGFEGDTDRTELTAWLMKEQGWLQKKENGKWKQFCPECKVEYYKSKRESYFSKGERL